MKKPIVIKRYDKYYIESAHQRVIQLFFTYPEKEFSLSEIAKEAKVKKSNIGKILNELHKQDFIDIIKLKTIWQVKANKDELNFIKFKIIYNLNFIYRSGLIEYLAEILHHPKSIILFGSFQRGEDTTDSDIDIAIWDDNIKEYKTTELKGLSYYEKEIKRNIQIHLFNDKSVDINIFNNIANGIVLYGFLQVKPYGSESNK